LLVAADVKVWFSEKDLGLGVPMMRAIDKGLPNSRIGLVLVIPNLLRRLPQEGVADKELSALLAGNRLVPIVHQTTYPELRNVSPLLAPEPAWTLPKTQWRWSRPRLPSWSPSGPSGLSSNRPRANYCWLLPPLRPLVSALGRCCLRTT